MADGERAANVAFFSVSIRDHVLALHSFRSKADGGKAEEHEPLRVRHSQSLASLRQRFSQAMARSTIQRLGRTAKPFATSDRLTISTSTWRMARRSPAWNFAP